MGISNISLRTGSNIAVSWSAAGPTETLTFVGGRGIGQDIISSDTFACCSTHSVQSIFALNVRFVSRSATTTKCRIKCGMHSLNGNNGGQEPLPGIYLTASQ
jgi:hypothetical protein